MADVALAGRVIASHYSEPFTRVCRTATDLTAEPSSGAVPIARLEAGQNFSVLECGRGLAWGYVEASGLVGYVDEDALV